MAQTAAINAARIEAIIIEHQVAGPRSTARGIARAIVEAFPELRPAQQEMRRDGMSRTIAVPLPWPTARFFRVWD